YSLDIAEEYGQRSSPYSLEGSFAMQVPSGLIKFDESVTLLALIRDSDNAIARHEIQIEAEADEINPEVAITRPSPGYGPTENSDFTLGFRAFDNVKIDSLELYTAYGVRQDDGTYVTTDFGAPVRTVTGIADRDYLPVTTINIDTPEYLQLLHVDPLNQIMQQQFPELTLTGNELFDIWVRVNARDISGNARTKEISFPIRIDERPVVDILTPEPGATVVEATPLIINVNAFDDVGIDSLTLTASHAGGEIYTLTLRQPPYSFQVNVPAFDPDNSANNKLQLHVEAIDTYGAAYGDLDKHAISEDLAVTIIQDQPPTVGIGLPVDNSEVTEGDYLLVQVNGVDDVGLDRVVLQVNGLISGDRSFTDTGFPYEFLVEVPYGQAGTDLHLSASAVERRYSGEARTATTPAPITVLVRKDVQAPELIVTEPPLQGATVVEKRALNFVAEASDDVAVTTLQAQLFANGNLVSQLIFTSPPYSGSLRVETIEDYVGADAAVGLTALPLELTVTAFDGAGNPAVVNRPVTLTRNSPPEVTAIQVLDQRGFSLGNNITEVTEGRGIVINVVATDPEVGVGSVRLFQSLTGQGEAAAFQEISNDQTAPFQTHIDVPLGHAGETLSFRAEATDIDGYVSPLSSVLNLTILEDQPPTAEIVKPDNDESVTIEGQEVEIFVEAIDDLGVDGIDRVVFYVNDEPLETVYNSYSQITGSYAQEHLYRALIAPPQGASGLVIQAEVFDVVGNSTRTQVVRIGKIEDTVAPDVDVLEPFDGEILTANETLRAVVAVSDIGVESERFVTMDWIREYQQADGTWSTIHSATRLLTSDATRGAGDTTPVSDPDNHYYIYWDDFLDSNLLIREQGRNERVRVVTRVTTPNHIVESETIHEVGLPIAERRFLLPYAPASDGTVSNGLKNTARSVYYTSVAQYQGENRTGALLGAWSNVDPMRLELGLGNLLQTEIAPANELHTAPRTGLFIADDTNETFQGDGEHFVYSDLLAGASEMFSGTITELHADANFVMAAKSGQLPTNVGDPGTFSERLQDGIEQESETGGVYLDNSGGELLIFTTRNGDGQFGLPYLLMGRVDMPYADLYGVARKDDLAFVANGNGGVQVIDISDFSAPYHVGFIKPNGFARDVIVRGQFAFIAASHEGVVVADIADPAMPIVATLDTLGVANRLQMEGSTLYVTDMAGDGLVSQLNIINVADPYHPVLSRTVDLYPARSDLVADGSYDVALAGNQAYVTVHYSDQEDSPAQSLVQIIDLSAMDDAKSDYTLPVMIHRDANQDDFAARGMVLARGAMQVAGGKQGIDRIELPALAVLRHSPETDARDVSTELESVRIELSAVLSPSTKLTDYIHILQGDPQIGVDVTDQFSIDFALRDGAPAYRFIELTRDPDTRLQPDAEYHVIIDAGLAPLTGLPLAGSYRFGFTTSPAGAAADPDIENVTPDTGGIDGGTEIVVRGTNFGANPQLFLGGQALVIDRIEAPTESDPFERIYASTTPNYAGPAALEVVNDQGLADRVIGAFTYVDILQITFIN
ncbi:MAG: Ig-like domain-containing protein, partial [Candidatus Thiodiazotropha sp.]